MHSSFQNIWLYTTEKYLFVQYDLSKDTSPKNHLKFSNHLSNFFSTQIQDEFVCIVTLLLSFNIDE